MRNSNSMNPESNWTPEYKIGIVHCEDGIALFCAHFINTTEQIVIKSIKIILWIINDRRGFTKDLHRSSHMGFLEQIS